MRLSRERVKGWKFDSADRMRKEMTVAEQKFWLAVNKDQIGLRFHRQKVIRGWIVDFWCPKKRLAVEIDGSIHNLPEVSRRDQVKDQSLRELGIRVFRFSNRQVLRDLPYVLHMIRD